MFNFLGDPSTRISNIANSMELTHQMKVMEPLIIIPS